LQCGLKVGLLEEEVWCEALVFWLKWLMGTKKTKVGFSFEEDGDEGYGLVMRVVAVTM
jgi:hypothetical protein